jgi:quaternary ammonium compound-resistance protein SugE
MPYVLLAFAICFEVLWAVLMKTHGFTVLWASMAILAAYYLSFIFLYLACRHLHVSVAYVVWTGLGATLVALIGVLAFDEPLGIARGCCFLLVIAGVVGLLGLEAPR